MLRPFSMSSLLNIAKDCFRVVTPSNFYTKKQTPGSSGVQNFTYFERAAVEHGLASDPPLREGPPSAVPTPAGRHLTALADSSTFAEFLEGEGLLGTGGPR